MSNTTTLPQIRALDPYVSDYHKLVEALGPQHRDDDPVSLELVARHMPDLQDGITMPLEWLEAALRILGGAIDTRSQTPFCRSILIESDGVTVRMTAVDGPALISLDVYHRPTGEVWPELSLAVDYQRARRAVALRKQSYPERRKSRNNKKNLPTTRIRATGITVGATADLLVIPAVEVKFPPYRNAIERYRSTEVVCTLDGRRLSRLLTGLKGDNNIIQLHKPVDQNSALHLTCYDKLPLGMEMTALLMPIHRYDDEIKVANDDN